MTGHTPWNRLKHKKDYRRHEVGILIGPCHPDEAEEFLEKVSDFVYDMKNNYGACVSMREIPAQMWDDD